jgi:hypothetical protein
MRAYDEFLLTPHPVLQLRTLRASFEQLFGSVDGLCEVDHGYKGYTFRGLLSYPNQGYHTKVPPAPTRRQRMRPTRVHVSCRAFSFCVRHLRNKRGQLP